MTTSTDTHVARLCFRHGTEKGFQTAAFLRHFESGDIAHTLCFAYYYRITAVDCSAVLLNEG